MKKVKILVLIITTVLLVYISYSTYKYFDNRPKRTGAAVSKQSNEERQEGTAINSLIKDVPVTINGFVIQRYDYSTGKFKVVLNGSLNSNPELFLNWLSASEYKDIPSSMFDISVSN